MWVSRRWKKLSTRIVGPHNKQLSIGGLLKASHQLSYPFFWYVPREWARQLRLLVYSHVENSHGSSYGGMTWEVTHSLSSRFYLDRGLYIFMGRYRTHGNFQGSSMKLSPRADGTLISTPRRTRLIWSVGVPSPRERVLRYYMGLWYYRHRGEVTLGY